MVSPSNRFARLAALLMSAALLAGCAGEDGGPPSNGEAAEPSGPSPSDGKGTAIVRPDTDVRVGERGTWSIVYEAGPDGIEVGGGVVLQVSPFWGWSPPQVSQPEAPGYVTASCSDPRVALALDGDPSRHWVRVILEDRPLDPGMTLTFVYGDTSGGARPTAAARVDTFAEKEEEFLVKVDGNGDGFYVPIAASPTLDIRPGPMARLVVHGPSLVRPGEEIDLRVAALDAAMNRAEDFTGKVRLQSIEPGIEHPDEMVFEPADRGAIVVRALAAHEGYARVMVSPADDPERLAVSNPIVATTAELPYRLYWGDLQIHSGLSDGSGMPEEIYSFARDVAGLDVAAVTDHDAHGVFALDERPDVWNRLLEAAEDFDDPGRFVTFAAFEWTSWTYGHKHVLFLDAAPSLLSNRDPATATPTGLWSRLPPGRALTISHHTLGRPVPTDWSFHDPRFERLVEICSIHGSSEAAGEPMSVRGAREGHGARDALGRGYRLGFVGSGDTHNGHPGLGDPTAPLGGVAGIYARDRTRESVWEALQERRVFASSGPRVVLDFTVNDERMGGTVRLASAETPRRIHVEAYSPIRIEGVEIVKNGEIVVREPVDRLTVGIDVDDPVAARPGDRYYVRLRLLHDQLVWSSPVWVDLEPRN